MALSVGIIGLIGSGKDTFGELLLDRLQKLEPRFQVDSYGRPLKKLGSEVLKIDPLSIDDRDIKEKEFDFRYTDEIETLLYNFMDKDLKFLGVELSEGLRKVRKNFEGVTKLSPRSFYQKFGTDVVRCTFDNAWIDLLRNNHKFHPVLARDVRFVNEMCDINILVCRHEDIDRPEHESEHLAWDLEFAGLSTDKEVIVVFNKGTLDDLGCSADAVTRYLKEENYL